MPNPDAKDAQLIMQLYDLRREAEMRKARDWSTQEFFPSSQEEIMTIFLAQGSDQNRWLRQVISYWEMVASFVNRGVLNRDLLEDSVGEYVNVYTKFRPFLKEIRQTIGYPEFMSNIERLVEESETGRRRVVMMEKWFAERRAREMQAAAARAKTA
ncbi:MAG: DUF4760 domain-containing protein [Terriglobales bacterium]